MRAVLTGSTIGLLTAFIGGCAMPPPDNDNSDDGAGAFSIAVVPSGMRDVIPDQRCVLLVTVQDESDGAAEAAPVTISATAAVTVERESIVPGEVAEITVIPERRSEPASAEPRVDPAADGDETDDESWTVTATITGQRDGVTRTLTVPLTITSQEVELVGPSAAEVRDKFIPWLAENQPELGITAQTEWTGTIVTLHILVVTHYLFFSDEWELHVYWHVMIPPYDWARIELRRRFEETTPSLAFEIASWTSEEPQEAYPIEPSEAIWR